MKHRGWAALVAIIGALGLFTGGIAQAQVGETPGMDLALMKLFGENKSFTTDAQVTITDAAGTPNLTLPINISQLNGEIRSEVDMEKAKGPTFPPEVLQQIKDMGMTHVISIIKPDTKEMFLIYPALNSYVKTDIPKDQVDALNSNSTITKTKLGEETVNDHPCVKSKAVVPDDHGKKQELFVWTATDLKDFPVRIQSITPHGTMTINYTGVKLAKPDAKLFETPPKYAKYDSQMELLSNVMKRSINGRKK